MSIPIHPQALSDRTANAPDTIIVALGANLPGPFGAPEDSVRHAIDALSSGDSKVIHAGGLFRSPAYPVGNGPDFVNTVVAVRSGDVAAFLDRAFAIETAFNRDAERAAGRWAPRSIDVDIIAIGSEVRPDPDTHARLRAREPHARVLSETGLVIPHPAMQERAFVLKPMAFIAPDWRHPALDRTALELASACAQEALDAVQPMV